VSPVTDKLFPIVTSSGKPIVKVSPDTLVSISFVVPETVIVSPKSIAFVPLSPESVIVEFVNEALPILVKVFEAPLIVLFVSVCVPVVVTNELGNVTVLDDKSKVVANLATVTALFAILPSVTFKLAILAVVTWSFPMC
jgi:hypothetical protein